MVRDLEVRSVHRDVILELRGQVLSQPGARVGAFPHDVAPTTRHWAALLGSEVVGCITIMELRGLALRGMAVSREHQRRGIGAALLRSVYAAVRVPMWCNARCDAEEFYARFGWTAVGPVFDIEGHGPHQRMVWSPPG